jgi:hypothetical protein
MLCVSGCPAITDCIIQCTEIVDKRAGVGVMLARYLEWDGYVCIVEL